jgi:ribosome modulation factor
MTVKHTVQVADNFAVLNVRSRCPVNQHTVRQTLYKGWIQGSGNTAVT